MKIINEKDVVLIKREKLSIVSKRSGIPKEKLCNPFIIRVSGLVACILEDIDIAVYNEEVVIVGVKLM